jgi:two-component system cell cycle sensor histidine kinase/response regulator CckA
MIAPTAFRNARILIVDDEPSILSFIDQAMRIAGHKTQTASSGLAALEMCAKNGVPDLLLTDYKMPGMDGDTLAAQLRQRDPDLKVLYLTGYADVLFQVRPILWANEAFLEKPFTADGLLEAVSLLVHGHVRHTPAAGANGTARER